MENELFKNLGTKKNFPKLKNEKKNFLVKFRGQNDIIPKKKKKKNQA